MVYCLLRPTRAWRTSRGAPGVAHARTSSPRAPHGDVGLVLRAPASRNGWPLHDYLGIPQGRHYSSATQALEQNSSQLSFNLILHFDSDRFKLNDPLTLIQSRYASFCHYYPSILRFKSLYSAFISHRISLHELCY